MVGAIKVSIFIMTLIVSVRIRTIDMGPSSNREDTSFAS